MIMIITLIVGPKVEIAAKKFYRMKAQDSQHNDNQDNNIQHKDTRHDNRVLLC
jgi:hypothetical protein